MSTTDPNRPGRADRAGGGMPRASTPVVAVVVAAVAGLLGLLILKDVKDGDSGGGGGSTAKTTTTVARSSTTGTVTPTTQAPQRRGATIVVANCSGQDGVAGALTTALKNREYDTGTATNCTSRLDKTVIMVKAGDAQAGLVAQTLMLDMGLTGGTQALTASPPITPGTLGSATILVLLGTDKAGQPLRPIGTTTATTTATATTGGGSDASDASD